MPTSNNTFFTGTVVSDAEIKTRLQDFEEWVNGGILAADTQGSAWVRSHHIYGPDFYGAPTPRAVLTTGDTHWRLSPQDSTRAVVLHEEMVGTIETGDGSNWIPVEGLNATIKLDKASNVVVMASWWAWETGNKNSNYLSLNSMEKDNYRVADFKLWQVKHVTDGTVPTSNAFDSTTQSLFLSHRINNNGWTRAGAKQMVCHRNITNLSAGIHTIGIRCHILPTMPTGSGSMNIFIRNRHLIVDVYRRP